MRPILIKTIIWSTAISLICFFIVISDNRVSDNCKTTAAFVDSCLVSGAPLPLFEAYPDSFRLDAQSFFGKMYLNLSDQSRIYLPQNILIDFIVWICIYEAIFLLFNRAKLSSTGLLSKNSRILLLAIILLCLIIFVVFGYITNTRIRFGA